MILAGLASSSRGLCAIPGGRWTAPGGGGGQAGRASTGREDAFAEHDATFLGIRLLPARGSAGNLLEAVVRALRCEARGHTTATQSPSMSKVSGHAGTRTKTRASRQAGK